MANESFQITVVIAGSCLFSCSIESIDLYDELINLAKMSLLNNVTKKNELIIHTKCEIL